VVSFSMSVRDCIPDWGRLVREVDARCTNHNTSIHGPQHWKCVAATGCAIINDAGEGDPAVVLLFGLLHDSMRLDDGHDREHGHRAAVFASELNGEYFHLEKQQIDLLQRACEGHTFGRLTKDPTIAACWDADRLNLWRLGVKPQERFLSTDAARKPRRIKWASEVVSQSFTWTEIFEAFRSVEKEKVRG
jgi:uncharacterized protein